MTKSLTKGTKHIPQRTCVACREVNDKRSLIRIVRTAEGVVVDPGGKLSGRGAYLHASKECREKALSKGILARSLKCEIDAENRDRIAAALEALEEK